MNPVLETIFSFSGGYNLRNRQVCSEFRSMIAEVSPLLYFDSLCADGRLPKHIQADEEWATMALERGYLHILQWSIHCYKGKNLCEQAAKLGHLEILKWARSQNYPWGPNVCSKAALHGYLEVLKWARENGCKWNKSVILNASIKNDLEILQWTIANGGEWHNICMIHIIRNGNMKTLQWAVANGGFTNVKFYVKRCFT
ncbi:Ankyrin repeat-containing protein [Cedratvirus Zaza IHUMI]|uniref:Ankyrin repeat-containing protein n=1 Tax=Cedratvirus Zaza IHUMI TaxID=2126979 RepID=A0A2R8FF12_9VIRU|nr:Ankyrin repeat-containing protein [Cedratvirus Zaza IHUMI]